MKFSRNPCLKLCSKLNKKGVFLPNFDLKNLMCFKLQMLDKSQVIDTNPNVRNSQVLSQNSDLWANTFKILSKILRKLKDCFFQQKGNWLIIMKFQRFVFLRYKNYMKLSAILDQSHICSSKGKQLSIENCKV